MIMEKTKRETRKQKNPERRQKYIRIGKLYTFMLVFLACLAYAGIYQVFMIKMIHGEEYEKRAISNQISGVMPKAITPNRGSIVDRNGASLAYSTTVYTVVLDIRTAVTLDYPIKKPKADEADGDEPEETNPDKTYLQEIAESLIELLEIPPEEMQEYIEYRTVDNVNKPVNYDTQYKIIRKEVPKKIAKEIERRNLKCVYLEEDTKRAYPQKTYAPEVIGFIRGDSLWGLENYYNKLLTGTPGRVFRTYEGTNAIATNQESPVEGYTLVTTIDSKLQEFAQDTAEAAFLEHNPRNTSVIIMKPKTGEILAMASYPTFDIKEPTNICYADLDIEALSNEQKTEKYYTAWKNQNVVDTFEQGSVYKPMLVAAALDEGVISKTDTFYCSGKKHFDTELPEGKDIYCNNRTGHGTLTLTQALAKSCNVAMMDIAAKLGKDKYLKYRSDFGFGEKTGIDLPSEEDAKKLLPPYSAFREVELATGAMGQGFNATPIQIINAFNAVINDGNLMRPYVVSQVIDSEGRIISENHPEVIRRVVSKDSSEFLRTALKNVFTPDGTGRRAVIEGYSIGGKTGTGEQGVRGSGQHTLSFAAYLPAEDPEIVAITIIHIPETYVDGVTSPAPMLRELLLKIIDYVPIAPTGNIAVSETTITVNDYTNKSIADATKEINESGYEYEIVGSKGDFVYSQIPAGGTKYEENMKIKLYIRKENPESDLITVPNVLGLSSEDAAKELNRIGFDCVTFERIADTENETEETEEAGKEETANKTVLEQMPEGGTSLARGSVIKIKT